MPRRTRRGLRRPLKRVGNRSCDTNDRQNRKTDLCTACEIAEKPHFGINFGWFRLSREEFAEQEIRRERFDERDGNEVAAMHMGNEVDATRAIFKDVLHACDRDEDSEGGNDGN